MVSDVLPAGYRFDVRSHAGRTCCSWQSTWRCGTDADIELFTQLHYRHSIAPIPSSPSCSGRFLFHWREESHARDLDELEWCATMRPDGRATRCRRRRVHRVGRRRGRHPARRMLGDGATSLRPAPHIDARGSRDRGWHSSRPIAWQYIPFRRPAPTSARFSPA